MNSIRPAGRVDGKIDELLDLQRHARAAFESFGGTRGLAERLTTVVGVTVWPGVGPAGGLEMRLG